MSSHYHTAKCCYLDIDAVIFFPLSYLDVKKIKEADERKGMKWKKKIKEKKRKEGEIGLNFFWMGRYGPYGVVEENGILDILYVNFI